MGWRRTAVYRFRWKKKHAIRVSTHRQGFPDEPVFPVRDGEATTFESPCFAKHPEAWTVANVAVEIGPIAKTDHPVVDEFNQKVLDLFNLAAGDILKNGSTLSWNIWFAAPGHVNQKEWRNHAERWRHSIDTDHGSPHGNGTQPKYSDGSLFYPAEALIDSALEEIYQWIIRHL